MLKKSVIEIYAFQRHGHFFIIMDILGNVEKETVDLVRSMLLLPVPIFIKTDSTIDLILSEF